MYTRRLIVLELSKKLLSDIKVSDYFGDEGVIGYTVSFNSLYNKDEVEEIKKILRINEVEFKILDIIRNMKHMINNYKTTEYEKLGIDLHDSMIQYFLKDSLKI